MHHNICIIGLGYVGLTLSVYLAHKGYKVHGIEISNIVLDSLNKNKAHFYEKDFDEYLHSVIKNGNFTFGKDFNNSSQKTIFIVTVGTPLDKQNKVNLNALRNVLHSVSDILETGDTVILRSTVKIGTTRNLAKKILDKSNKEYHLGFCPERTLEGSAFEELANLPQIISAINEDSLKIIKDFFCNISKEVVSLNSVEEAEMVKLLNNSERDLMFALSNEVALIAEEYGLDAYRIINAANYRYPRSNIKKPGPVGGPCLEKDPYIMLEDSIHCKHSLFITGRKINESIIAKGLDRFFTKFDRINSDKLPKKISILGFAFKGNPPTGDVRGSPVYKIIEYIRSRYNHDYILSGHDYLATNEDIINAGADESSSDIRHVMAKADIVIIQNNNPSYKQENWLELQSLLSDGSMIYDFWNQLDDKLFSNNTTYTAFGRR